MEPLLSLQNVSVRYGPVQVLRSISCTVPSGVIGLLGPNGAGKSTLLKSLLGLLPGREGQISLFGKDIATHWNTLRDRLGYMPESDGYFPEATAIESVRYSGELSGLPRQEAIARAHEVLYYVGLEESRYRQVSDFSTGMRQRVKLAQAIVHDPDLVLLDEPTSGMDPKGRDEMLGLIRDLGNRRAPTATRPAMSVILSTHLLPDVESVCSDVIMLQSGSITYTGSLSSVRGQDQQRLKVRVKNRQADFATALTAAGLSVQESEEHLLVSAPTAEYKQTLDTIWAVARQGGFQIRELSSSTRSLEEHFFSSVGA